MAAVKKRYGTSRKPIKTDLATAEEVQEKLEGVWLKLHNYRRPIIGGFGVLFLVVTGLSVMESAQESSQMEANGALNGVLDTANAPVFEEPAPEGFEGISFQSDTARMEATSTKATDGSDVLGSGGLNGLASAVVASSAYSAGDYKASQEWSAKAQTALKDTKLVAIIALQGATAAAASGKLEEAKVGFNQALTSTSPYIQVAAHRGLGDLAHPSLGGGGTAEEAKGQYEKAQALLSSISTTTAREALQVELDGRINSL